MSITDELREWVTDHYSGWKSKQAEGIAIADRIDAEHERLMRERRGCIHYDQERHYCNVHDLTTEDYKRGYDDGFASADDWLGQHESDMAEHGWVRLPKDADEVPWNVGDRDEDGNVVTQLRLSSDGWYAITDGLSAFHPEQRRHHHAPTVEDVLREFGIDWEHESDCEDRAALLKEYASKLQLKEDK